MAQEEFDLMELAKKHLQSIQRTQGFYISLHSAGIGTLYVYAAVYMLA